MARRWGQISHLHATSRMQSMRAHSLWSRVVSADRSSRCSYRPVQLQDRHASLPTPAQTTRMAAPSRKKIPEHYDHSARDGLGSVPSRGSGTQPKPTRTPALHQHTSHHTDTHAQHTHQTHARHDHQIPNQPQKSQTPNQPTTKPKPTTNPNKPTNPQQKPTTNPNKSQRTQQNPPPPPKHKNISTRVRISREKGEEKRGKEGEENRKGKRKRRREREKYQHTGSNRGLHTVPDDNAALLQLSSGHVLTHPFTTHPPAR